MKNSLLSLLSILIISFGSTQMLQAQTHLGIHGQIGVPVGDFAENTNSIGGGFNIDVFVPFSPNVPIFFGFGLGYMMYGTESQDINEELELRLGNALLDRIPVNLRVTTTNNILQGRTGIRFKAPLTTVQPYIDGIVGFNYIYTRTRVLDNTPDRLFTDPEGSNVITARTNQQDFVLSYGGAFGMMIKLGPNVSLDISGTYLMGGEAEYYDREQIRELELSWGGTEASFDPDNLDPDQIDITDPETTAKKSATDMFMINAGIAINF